MPRITREDALASIQSHPFSFVVANKNGEIVDVVGMDELPHSDFITRMSEKYPGAGAKFVDATSIDNTEGISRVVKGIVDALNYKGPLKPGANSAPPRSEE